LSAGPINSPQLLMLSGIGPKDHLKNHKIPVIQDLQVGQHLQDHYGTVGIYFTFKNYNHYFIFILHHIGTYINNINTYIQYTYIICLCTSLIHK
jgi:choline dehydrogenase-like flavoprotein